MKQTILGLLLLFGVIACQGGGADSMTNEEIADKICTCSEELVAYNMQILEKRKDYTREEMMEKMKEAEVLRKEMLTCLEKDFTANSIDPERDAEIMVQLRVRCAKLPRNIASEILNDIHQIE